MTNKKTSSKVATQAAKTLKSKDSSKIQKQLAGSVLSQRSWKNSSKSSFKW